MDGDMVSMLYLVNQFPSAAFHLKDIWYYLISRVFKLVICAVTSPLATGPRLISPIIAGRTLGSASVAKHCQVVLGQYSNESGLEIVDLFFCVSLVSVQCRRKIVQFTCEFKAVVYVFEYKQFFLSINLQRFSIGF